METNLDKIQSKLRKLKALYEGAKAINSEGEANAAAAAISRLLTAYNLTMDEIGEEKNKDEVLEERHSGYTYKSIGGEWEFRLTYIISKWNFCKCFMYGKTYKQMMIFGKKENIETVKWLREMLSERFVAFSKNRFKEFQKTAEFQYKPISIDAFQRRYLMGCAAGLDIKLKQESDLEKKQDVVIGAKITALVVRNSQAVDTFIANKYKTGNGRKSTTKADGHFHQGVEDGRNTTLNKQVGASKAAQVAKVGLLN